MPYLLVLPVIAAVGAILGYPLYRLVVLSFQRYGLPELIQRKGEWIGLDNYRSVLGDSIFWDTPRPDGRLHRGERRADDGARPAIALLLVRLPPVRILLTAGLVLVWAMPAVVRSRSGTG